MLSKAIFKKYEAPGYAGYTFMAMATEVLNAIKMEVYRKLELSWKEAMEGKTMPSNLEYFVLPRKLAKKP